MKSGKAVCFGRPLFLAETAPGDYAGSIQEAVKNGASPDQVLRYATADVAMEVIAERVPMDELLGSAAGNPKRAAGIMDAALKQYGIRMTGEELGWLGRVAAEASRLQQHPAFAKVTALERLKGQNYEQAQVAASRVVWQQTLDWAVDTGAFEGVSSLDENAIDGREALGNNALENPGEADVPLTGEQGISEVYGQQEAIDQTAQLGSDSLGEVGDGAVSEERQVHSQELEQEFMEFKEVLGEDAPETLEDFKNLKYNDPDKWERMREFREYKERVPEASEDDFQKYLNVRATGEKGIIRIPPEEIDASGLTFRDAHAAHHGCTVEQARDYVKNAYCAIYKERWDGVSVNFFSADGAAYIDIDTMQIKTSFPREKYDPHTNEIVEVFE